MALNSLYCADMPLSNYSLTLCELRVTTRFTFDKRIYWFRTSSRFYLHWPIWLRKLSV